MSLEKTNKNLPLKSSSGVQTIGQSDDSDIKNTLRYIMALIGVPADKIPTGITRDLMLSYIKDKWANSDIMEMQVAFEWAVDSQIKDNRGNPVLALYDRPFNLDFIKSIVVLYRESKTKQIKPINGMTNNQRAGAIFSMMKEQQPELYQKLKELGKEKKQEQPTPPRQPDIFQIWMNQFYNLKRKYLYEGYFVKIGDTIFNIDSFLDRKLSNYNNK